MQKLKKTFSHPKTPVVMTIAGSDSSGGAGIQADLKTFTALQCYGASVLTALTAQNTVGVEAVHAPPPEFVKQQLLSVLNDMEIGAFKTGMMFDAANTQAAASTLKSFFDPATGRQRPPIVVDPVCVSTSGHTLLDPSAVEVMVADLFPLATVITPNKSEAELLLSLKGIKLKIGTLESALVAVQKLSECTEGAVLLKGGHLVVRPTDIEAFSKMHADIQVEWERPGSSNMEILNSRQSKDHELVMDLLFDKETLRSILFARPRIDSPSTHGTGCTLSAALACYLSRGHSIQDATRLAAAYTHLGIETALPLGNGHGPLNHLHTISTRLIPPPTPSNPYPFTVSLIRSNATIWKQYVEHDFVKQLGAGILPRENFIHFIKQDYQYLKYYARAYGLLISKSGSFSLIHTSSKTIESIIREVTMHKSYCSEWGIDESELETTAESPATTAYGAYLLDVGLHGDATKLIIALGACLLGYGEVGLWLQSEALADNSWVKLKGNPYLKWIEDYSGKDYQDAVTLGLRILEDSASDDPPSLKRYDEWKEVWGRCTRLEKGFWDMAMALN